VGGIEVEEVMAAGGADFDAVEGEEGGGLLVHVVTEAEAEAGVFSIDDVVLPMPGHRITLPQNEVAKTYHTLLERHGLEMTAFAHRIKELALPGSYRRLLGRPKQLEWKILRYDDHTLPLSPTDLTRLRGDPEPLSVPEGQLVALRLEFTLAPSSYATMLLRELTKQPTDFAHQMKLNAEPHGRADGQAAPEGEGAKEAVARAE